MGVVNKKGAAITNNTASPRVLNSSFVEGGLLRASVGVVDLAIADSTSSTLRFCKVPSSARVHSVRLWSPDVGTTSAMNVGLWSHATPDATGTVVDADFFATDLTMLAAQNGLEICHEGDVTPGFNILRAEKQIWEVLGLSSDPGIMYDVVGQLTGAIDATGAMCLKLEYVM